MGQRDDEEAVEAAKQTIAWAVRALTEGAAATEVLARFEAAKRRMLVTVRPKMVPLGAVWRLGVVLLDAGGRMYATGSVTRAVDPKWPQHIADSMEVRRAQRGAAFRASFAPGASIDFDAEPIDVSVDALRHSAGPILLRDGRVVALWAPGSSPQPFDDYLHERVDLALHPFEGDGRS
jgi:hypothetical protein